MKTKTIIHNLTLIELLISLGILAAIATITLSMLEESGAQQRFKRTWETGEDIREIINAGKNDDGVSRFISDMGRLPAVINTGEGMRLAEFYHESSVNEAAKWSSSVVFNNNDASLPSVDSSLTFPDDFVNLKLPGGWAGPYLYNSRETLFDGWNNEWQLLDSAYNKIESPVAGTFFYGIESLGSNNSVDEDNWSSKSQVFKFNTSGTATADRASLIVTIMVRDDSSLNPVLRPAVEYKSPSASDWAAGTEYKINDEVKSGSFVFRCISSNVINKGKSSASEPSWSTATETPDNNIIWEYSGIAGSEAAWQTSHIYSKNDQIQAGGNAFTCVRVRGLSASSAPVFSTQYGDMTTDGDFSWKCVYPEPAIMNYLRAAVFMPRVAVTEKGVRRFMAIRNDGGTTTTDSNDSITFSDGNFFVSMPEETAEWTAYNQVVLKNLPPGNRKLYAYGFFKSGTEYRNKRGSGVLDVKLSPGVNRITVHLTNNL
jgi:type II secretory pathway pseudopilin PulG